MKKKMDCLCILSMKNILLNTTKRIWKVIAMRKPVKCATSISLGQPVHLHDLTEALVFNKW